MDDIKVIHRQDDAFAILVRDHVIHVDQPYSDGGQDAGPTPVELFVASLAACAAYYGRRHLKRRGMPADGLEVTSTFVMSGVRPARVTRIDLNVRPPEALPETELDGLYEAIGQCTVRNSIVRPLRLHVNVEARIRPA